MYGQQPTGNSIGVVRQITFANVSGPFLEHNRIPASEPDSRFEVDTVKYIQTTQPVPAGWKWAMHEFGGKIVKHLQCQFRIRQGRQNTSGEIVQSEAI